MLRRLAILVSWCCMSLLLLGATCSKEPRRPRPRPFDLQFAIGPAVTGVVQVDVIGISTGPGLVRLEQYPVSQYWRRGDPLRLEVARKSFVFPPEGQRDGILEASDDIWTTWLRNGADVVVIIADLPGVHTTSPGASDPRRWIETIDANVWRDVRKLEFVVQGSGIQRTTPRPSN